MVAPNQPNARPGLRLMLACVLAFAAYERAVADEFDTFNVIAGSQLRYDTNVFRAPDNASPQSDTANVSYIGFTLDKPYSMQRVQVRATETATRYANNDSLNNDALNYSAAWLWALTPHLTGTLSSDRLQTQIPFSQIGGNQRNVITSRSNNFTFDGTISGAWHVIGAYSQAESSTEQPVFNVPSQRYHRAEGGLRYVTRAGNVISAVYRYIPTHITDQPLNPAILIDTDFQDTERELRGEWNLTGKSTVYGRVVYKRRTNQHFSQRDFSGTAAELRYLWKVTGKTQLTAAVLRDYLPYAGFGNVLENSTYRVDNTLNLGALYQATAKIVGHANVGYTRSDFRGPVFFPLTSPPREDRAFVMQVGADWQIARAVALYANFTHEQRSSNLQQFQFSNNELMMGAALRF